MYQLDFLPSAVADMAEIVRYISHDLLNRMSAISLAEEFIQAATRVSEFPYANPLYQPVRPLKHEYRKVVVGNHLMLYWVDEMTKTVTIARIVYAKRDYGKLIN